MEKLYRENSLEEQAYDDALYSAKSLEKKADALKADVERSKTEIEKKSIKAPVDGVVVEKKTEVGEWLAPGDFVRVDSSSCSLICFFSSFMAVSLISRSLVRWFICAPIAL